MASNTDLITAYSADRSLVTRHFVEFGHSEGRNISSFNASNYISAYSDLQAAYGSDLSGATEHYVVFGFNEERVF